MLKEILFITLLVANGAFATTIEEDDPDVDYYEAYGTQTAKPENPEATATTKRLPQAMKVKKQPGERSTKGPPFPDSDLEESMR